MRKGFIRILTATALLSMLASSTVFAGQWQSDSNGWWYQNDDGSYATNGWRWIDGNGDGVSESYYFDGNGYLLTNATQDGFTVNADGAWIVNGVVQTQGQTQASNSDEFPLKGRVEKYLGQENGLLVWYWSGPHVILEGIVPDGMTGWTYVDKKSIENRDPNYHVGLSGRGMAVLGLLSGYPYKDICSNDIETTKLLNEVKAFMNSFDWKNASDLEKATRICKRIHQASYDHAAANEADETGWSESPSYGAYGCLVNGKAVCQGYVEAAQLLSLAVGLDVGQMGDVGHAYPVFLVDGVWLGNEPTAKDKYFVVEDVYRKNIIGIYQVLGQYCEGVGYTVPTDLSELPDWPGKREETQFGKEVLTVHFQ